MAEGSLIASADTRRGSSHLTLRLFFSCSRQQLWGKHQGGRDLGDRWFSNGDILCPEERIFLGATESLEGAGTVSCLWGLN